MSHMTTDKLSRVRAARKHHKSQEQRRAEAMVRQEKYNKLSLAQKMAKCPTATREYMRLLKAANDAAKAEKTQPKKGKK